MNEVLRVKLCVGSSVFVLACCPIGRRDEPGRAGQGLHVGWWVHMQPGHRGLQPFTTKPLPGKTNER